jgi:hypothetical protein
VFDDDGMLVVDMTASLCIEGFRAWVTDDRARLEKCNCDFGGCENAEVNPHYRLSERYWPGPAPHDADVSLQSTGGVGFAGMASRHCSRVCLSGFRGSLMLTRVVQIQHLCYVRRFQRVLPVAIEASKPSAASLHQRPPHGSVALETARRRKVSNNHDAHPELGGSTKLSVTEIEAEDGR